MIEGHRYIENMYIRGITMNSRIKNPVHQILKHIYKIYIHILVLDKQNR